MIEGSYFEPEDEAVGVRPGRCSRPVLRPPAPARASRGRTRGSRAGDRGHPRAAARRRVRAGVAGRREADAHAAVPPSPGGQAVSLGGQARNWIAWARAPHHDAYWEYSPRFFELVPRRGPGDARDRLRGGPRRARSGRAGTSRHRRRCVPDAARGRSRGPAGRRFPARGRRCAALPGRELRPGRRVQLTDGHRRHAGRGARGGARSDAGRTHVRVHHASLPGRRAVRRDERPKRRS